MRMIHTLIIIILLSCKFIKFTHCRVKCICLYKAKKHSNILLCSGQGKTVVLTGVGIPHKEEHYNPQDVKNWEKRTPTSQLRYDLNQKTQQIEC